MTISAHEAAYGWQAREAEHYRQMAAASEGDDNGGPNVKALDASLKSIDKLIKRVEDQLIDLNQRERSVSELYGRGR